MNQISADKSTVVLQTLTVIQSPWGTVPLLESHTVVPQDVRLHLAILLHSAQLRKHGLLHSVLQLAVTQSVIIPRGTWLLHLQTNPNFWLTLGVVFRGLGGEHYTRLVSICQLQGMDWCYFVVWSFESQKQGFCSRSLFCPMKRDQSLNVMQSLFVKLLSFNNSMVNKVNVDFICIMCTSCKWKLYNSILEGNILIFAFSYSKKKIHFVIVTFEDFLNQYM